MRIRKMKPVIILLVIAIAVFVSLGLLVLVDTLNSQEARLNEFQRQDDIEVRSFQYRD